MRSRLLLGVGALFVASAWAADTAHGATITFSDQSSFLSALLPGAYTESFNGFPFPSTPLGTPLNFSAGGFDYSMTAPGGFSSAGNSSADVWVSTNSASDPMLFTMTAGNPNAIGGFFFITDVNGFSVGSTTSSVEVKVNDGTTVVVPANSTPTNSFVGFISDVPITSLTVTRLSNGGGTSFWPTVNNVTVGTSALDIPEMDPGSAASAFALLGCGAILLRGRVVRRS